MTDIAITVPADPEEYNDVRAEFAETALLSFADETGQKPGVDGWAEIVGDFLCDLAHFCDRQNLHLHQLVDRAISNYAEETDGEGIQFGANPEGEPTLESLAQPPSTLPPFDSQDLATVLAALRYYQQHGQGDPYNRTDDIHDIATADDTAISLDDAGIDDLCDRLNSSPAPHRPSTVDVAEHHSHDLVGALILAHAREHLYTISPVPPQRRLTFTRSNPAPFLLGEE